LAAPPSRAFLRRRERPQLPLRERTVPRRLTACCFAVRRRNRCSLTCFPARSGPSKRWCLVRDSWGVSGQGGSDSVVRCPGRPSFGSTWPFLGDAVCSLRRMTTDAANGDE
jgi:hypothetical protein